jgi:hypothetical protein
MIRFLPTPCEELIGRMLVGMRDEVKEVRNAAGAGILIIWTRTSGQQSALSYNQARGGRLNIES